MTDVVDLFLAVASELGEHPAIATDDEKVTYTELSIRGRSIAAALLDRGHAPRVLIHLPQCADAYATMFAVLMAGGYYAPVNTDAPFARQRAIVDKFNPDVVVGTAASAEFLSACGLAKDILIDVGQRLPAPLPKPMPPGTLAYVLFTSGSTGIPKGVMVGRKGLNHYVSWCHRAMNVTPQDRWSQHPNIAFDLSVLDIFGALCAGACLYPLGGAKDRLFPGDAIRRHQLTIWNSVPSVMTLITRARHATPEFLCSLRLATFCGEPLLPEHLRALFDAVPNLSVHNTYGPTEATVSCTLLPLNANMYQSACRATVAIGEAIEGMELRLEGGNDANHGEIVIYGPQVAHGYWQDTEATQAAFLSRSPQSAPYAYRTGDLAERVDGQLYFLGRKDTQVKLMGHRLELEEVNAALRRCGIPQACSAVIDGKLHAFLELPGPINLDRLKSDLLLELEAFAVPGHFHLFDRLPRNMNDKIDVRSLIEAFHSH
ncbi:MAG: AMP-binding protein [Alphaproteobacteria bacterium]|nr:AMP-binding protein [Alphaproteobacteria bacterium]